jgi:hypothetical protein
MSKKGFLVPATLAKLLLLLAGLIILGAIVAKLLSMAEERVEEVTCRESVDFRTATAVNAKVLGVGPEELKGSPFLCKTIDEKVSGTRDEVMEQLSDMVDQCWWMFREGRTEDLFKNLPGSGGSNKGMVCYAAIIEDIKDDSVITGQDFIEHLFTRQHPKLKDGESYIDYIQYAGGPGRVMMFLTGEGDTGVFREGYAYEIAFIEKGGNGNEFLVGAFGTSVSVLSASAGAVALSIAGGPVTFIAGAVLVGTGIAGGAITTDIILDEILEEKDVASIMVVDMSDTQLREKLHDNTLVDGIGGR